MYNFKVNQYFWRHRRPILAPPRNSSLGHFGDDVGGGVFNLLDAGGAHYPGQTDWEDGTLV